MDRSKLLGEWRKTSILLRDIRLVTLQQGEEPRPYCLPANAFLFAVQGQASLQLDGVPVRDTHHQLLHASKGSLIDIRGLAGGYAYYLILYQPWNKNRAVLKRDGEATRLAHHYAFRSPQPWQLQLLLEPMHRLWREGGDLERLQVNGLFYQFVVEHFRQLQIEEKQRAAPVLADEIASYIRNHYRTPISMDTLASLFHYSTHYLARLFKRKYGTSPIGYLVQIRMNQAKQLLAETNLPVLDVANRVGYADMYYFNKMFKKQIGYSPVQFKMQMLGPKGSNRSKFTSKSFIAPPESPAYIVNSESENDYQQYGWSVNELQFNWKPSLATSLALSLSILLAACGGSGENNGQAASQERARQTGSPASQETIGGTRLYTDASGNKVEIPVEPRRAVVVVYGGYLLPLGLMPVGADQDTLARYPADMADVADIGEGLGSEEAILALEPDLIIVPDYFDPGNYSGYSKIAPTITVAWGGDPDVVNTLRTMGDVMNRKTEAEAWIAKFEEKLQRIRDQIDVKIEPDTTATTFIFYEGEFLIGGEGGTLGKLIYQDYGFQMPEKLKRYADGGTALSIEAFIDAPADYFITQMTDEELPSLVERFKEPVYQGIPAIKNNRVININRENLNYGPNLVEQAVDELITQMNALQ